MFLPTSTSISVLVLLSSSMLMFWFLKSSRSRSGQERKQAVPPEKLPEATQNLVNQLTSALSSESVLSQSEALSFSKHGHWAQQECEQTPACVVQPRDSGQLSSAIKILHDEYVNALGRTSRPSKRNIEPRRTALFAVRGGGHSAVAGAASIKQGVLIDLGQLSHVEISNDRKTVSVGAGARWMDVSRTLDKAGLAAVGGRNSHVGVGGLTLGGGLSFFSPRFGLVCSNVLEYEIVIASGELITASESNNLDLWKALKGGANNFGIVTRFTLRCFPCDDIWAGFLYMPGNKQNQVLAAFHQAVARADPSSPNRDVYAAGPIACFTYLQGLPFQIISVNLVYTKVEAATGSKWPGYWSSSGFSSIWRIWSTVKARSLTDATDEMNTLNPPGRRQVLAATTVKNDPATLDAAYKAYNKAQISVKRVKGISWTMVMQPFMPEWARKGDPNPLGLDEGPSEPLVMVSFTVNWGDAKDDAFAKAETRRVVDEIEEFAKANGTAHRYRYSNYCGDWQDPFTGYGQKNLDFLRDVSKKFDPKGMFQDGCPGGFKLGN